MVVIVLKNLTEVAGDSECEVSEYTVHHSCLVLATTADGHIVLQGLYVHMHTFIACYFES